MYQTLGICKPIDRADSPMNKLFAHGKKTKDKGTRRLAIRRQVMVRHVRGNSRMGIWQLVGSGSCSIHRRTSRTEQKRKRSDRHISFSQVHCACWQCSHRQMPGAENVRQHPGGARETLWTNSVAPPERSLGRVLDCNRRNHTLLFGKGGSTGVPEYRCSGRSGCAVRTRTGFFQNGGP